MLFSSQIWRNIGRGFYGFCTGILLLGVDTALAQSVAVGQGVTVQNVTWNAPNGAFDIAFNRGNFGGIGYGVHVVGNRNNLATADLALLLTVNPDLTCGADSICRTSGARINRARTSGASQSVAIAAGSYYIAIRQTATGATRYTPAATELGGAYHPIVFPTATPTAPFNLTAEHTSGGIAVAWTKGAGVRHSGFNIYHATSAGVDQTSPNPLRVTEADAGCENTAIRCQFTLPYASTRVANAVVVGRSDNMLPAAFTAAGNYYFKIGAVINQSTPTMSAENSAIGTATDPGGDDNNNGNNGNNGNGTDSGNGGEIPRPTADELAATAVPKIMNAISTSIAANTAARVRQLKAASAAGAALVHADIHLTANDLWGQGSHQRLGGDRDGVNWDGSLLGFSLGADTRLQNGGLLGAVFNRQMGTFDVTRSGRTSAYKLTLSAYTERQFRGLDYHASASLGSGKFGDHSLKRLGVAVGGNRWFRDNRFGTQHLKGDLLLSRVGVGGARSNAVRVRVVLEQNKLHALANGGKLHLNGDLGGRLDLGSGSGLGVEAVGGVQHVRGRVELHGQIRTLLFDSQDVSEFGLQVRGQMAPGQDQQGLSLQVTPSYGEAESGLAHLWEHGVAKTGISNPTAAHRADYTWQMDARLGFGLRFKRTGLFTPYVHHHYGDAPRFGLGVNWKPWRRELELDLSGEQTETQQRVLLKGTVGF